MTSNIKHIVMAEDDQDDVEMFQAAVDETCPDLNLTFAADGVVLMSLLDEIIKPDIIFLDLNMPLKDGKECLGSIRMKKEFDEVPVVIFSTSGQKADIDFCMNNGANHYLVKPNSYIDMIAIVQNLCSGHLSITN